MIKRSMIYIGAAVIAVSALAGCSSTSPQSGYGSTGGGSSSSAPASSGGLATASTSLGTVVVDSNRMTVYNFKKDVKGSGKSNCTGPCALLWHAVVAPSSTPQAKGVTGAVGTITLAGGTMQVTINGLPVYTYTKDSSAGDVNGQGVGGLWYVVAPTGTAITGGKAGY